MQKILFISGIDTGCGKTYVTGLMAKAYSEAGISVITQKIVQTGCTGISEDIIEHRRIMGLDLFTEDKNGLTCPYVLSYPASPHLAARLENVTIQVDVLTEVTQRLSHKYNIVLIEGAGGLHVPIAHNMLTIDYIKHQKYPLVLVSSSKLGSINHSLLSIESCSLHNINLKAVIFNHFPDDEAIIADETYQVIKKTLSKKYPQALLYRVKNGQINDNILNLIKIKTTNK